MKCNSKLRIVTNRCVWFLQRHALTLCYLVLLSVIRKKTYKQDWKLFGWLGDHREYWIMGVVTGSHPDPLGGQNKIYLLGQCRTLLAVQGTQCGKQQLGKKVLSFWWINQLNIPHPVKCGQKGNVWTWELEDGVWTACVFGTAAETASGALYPVVMPSVWGGWWWIDECSEDSHKKD